MYARLARPKTDQTACATRKARAARLSSPHVVALAIQVPRYDEPGRGARLDGSVDEPFLGFITELPCRTGPR
jgi:hypothetical protein